MWQKSFPNATENAGDHPILWQNHLIYAIQWDDPPLFFPFDIGHCEMNLIAFRHESYHQKIMSYEMILGSKKISWNFGVPQNQSPNHT